MTEQDEYDEITRLAEDEDDAEDDGRELGGLASSNSKGTAKTEAEAQRERKARRISSIRQIAQHNQERLEEIYTEFDPDDPPDSIEKLRRELSRIELATAVHEAVGEATSYRAVEYNGDLPRPVAGQDRERIAVRYQREGHEESPEVARQSIELLATHGGEAEYELAALGASGNLPDEFQQLALEKLTEIREERTSQPDTLREALIQRISPGGGR